MKNFNKKANFVFLTLILTSYIFTSFLGIPLTRNLNITSSQINSDLISFQIEEDIVYINNWEKMISKFDKNGNEIADQLDNKLEILEISSDLVNSGSSDQINFIIQFPDDYDYSNAIMIFKNNGGIIKNTYSAAINGFAGNIDYNGIDIFCETLRQNDIKFLIEEDVKVKANLYYTSRNLNLRPYVWKELNSGYTGDNTSSIAILDTGIDVTHEYFDNFSNGDFSNKIVNWTDFTLGGDNTTVYDDAGHGSHVAGIAAGMGTPILDGSGRIVSTDTRFYNITGVDVSAGDALGDEIFSFYVPSSGQIEIECNFTDYTPGLDRTQGWAWLSKGPLLQGGDLVASLSPMNDNWENNFTYTVSPGKEGIYELWVLFYMDDGDLDGWVTNSSARFRGEIHWPFQPSTFGCGNRWKGVAPNTHLVGVKVLGGDGSGLVSWLIKGVDYVINNRKDYNITIMSMSLGIEDHEVSDISLINAVNRAVENGIVTVVSAGNDGARGNKIGCPGDADKVITVAAMNYRDQVTVYSSQGGGSYSGNTSKPDLMAPGGSENYYHMFSADTNENDGQKYPNDNYLNDLMPAQGTSMAAPVVAGAANLLIEAMGGGNNWDWDSGNKSKLVKSILLMTATETFPLQREKDTSYSPTLNRGGKDVHEGYGRLNIDAAIEAWTKNLTGIENINVTLYSSVENSYEKHASAGYVNLEADETYLFNLTVPAGKDYDLYLYNYTFKEYGEPDLIASSTSAILGQDEQINFTAKHDGKYFLVAKAIGQPFPSDDEDDDDDDKVTILDISLIVIISAIVALIAIIIVIIIYRRSKEDYSYEYRPEY